jgi:hypothetical protein
MGNFSVSIGFLGNSQVTSSYLTILIELSVPKWRNRLLRRKERKRRRKERRGRTIA